MTESDQPEKILVALSGGVDSSVAAALLCEQGIPVEAAYMKNWINEDEIFGNCPWEEDIEDAQAVADTLGIPFRIVNLITEYKERIVDYLVAGYTNGITPNPDVMCNREIKFGAFRDVATDLGFAAVATGHYAQNRLADDGLWELFEGADPNKDQSYFLALMQQEQIAAARFPIGHLPKPQVREEAKRFGLPTATKKDSQGICFIGKIQMADFLAAYVPDNPGPIVDPSGKRVGEHRGLPFFTFGQRRGIGVASAVEGMHYVVVDKRAETNELVIALEGPETPRLWARACTVCHISTTGRPLDAARNMLVRPRYRAPAYPAHFEPLGDGRARVTFSEPQRALTPGQIAAFHDGPVVLGGAVFEEIDYDA